ncbi:hypothetical protein [Brachybacterium alimentarium]|uniref:hypothetical protein n=1 Tax=Brachybacterium alimentarium TaxID=47845 RepID=UPI0015F0E6B0|nr:hypothetical protein [Brachybacterium alimentarium]
MKRAEVFKARVNGVPCWHIDVWDMSGRTVICTERPTHAAALAHALAEVGLTKKEQS